jgi:hypothetical protein
MEITENHLILFFNPLYSTSSFDMEITENHLILFFNPLYSTSSFDNFESILPSVCLMILHSPHHHLIILNQFFPLSV